MATAAPAPSNNPLQDLLAAGLSAGSQFALGKLFGSTPASETTKQAEAVAIGKVNGSGPVNARGSMSSPKSWTDMFFGTKAASDTLPNQQPAGMSVLLKVVIAAAVLGLGWFIWKKS